MVYVYYAFNELTENAQNASNNEIYVRSPMYKIIRHFFLIETIW